MSNENICTPVLRLVSAHLANNHYLVVAGALDGANNANSRPELHQVYLDLWKIKKKYAHTLGARTSDMRDMLYSLRLSVHDSTTLEDLNFCYCAAKILGTIFSGVSAVDLVETREWNMINKLREIKGD